MLRSPMLLALLVLLGPTAAAAQDDDSPWRFVAEGTRVRVHAPAALESPLVGTLSRVTPDTLFVARGGTLRAVPLDQVREVEVGRGGRQLRGAGWGALAGAAFGAVLGAMVGGGECEYCLSRGEGAAMGAVALTLPGAGIGALIGVDRWRSARVGPPLGAAPEAGAGPAPGLVVGLSLSTR